MPYKDIEAKRAQARSWAKAKRLRWTEAERAKRHAYDSAYYTANKEELAAKTHVYNAAHKAEVDARSHAYYAAHKAEINARNRAYKAAHRADLLAKKRLHDAAHREELAAKAHVYRLAHKEELAAKFSAYAAVHKKELAAKDRAYRLAHPEEIAAKQDRRRARQAGASVNDLTAAQWREILAAYDHRCVYCHRRMQRLTKDHIVPLVKGGTHTFSNIVPACKSCNSKKGAGAPLVPVQPLLLTIAASRSA